MREELTTTKPRKTVTWMVSIMIPVMVFFQFIFPLGGGSLKQWQNQHSSLMFETSQLQQEQEHRRDIDVEGSLSSRNETNTTSSSSSSSSSSGPGIYFADNAKDNTTARTGTSRNENSDSDRSDSRATGNQFNEKTTSPSSSSTLSKNDTHQQEQEVGVTDDGIIHTCRYKNETYQMPHFPAFIIAGAQKTGTTSLESYFAHFPGLLKSKGKTENHFFDAKIHGVLRSSQSADSNRWCKIRQAYYETWPERRLEKWEDKRTSIQEEEIEGEGSERNERNVLYPNPYKYHLFEKTPSYLPKTRTPSFLKMTCPWIPKVIIILRDPVERAYSWYKMEMTYHRNDRSFEEWLKLEVDHMRKLGMTTAPSLIIRNNTTIDVQRLKKGQYQEQQGLEEGKRDEMERQVLPDWNHTIPVYKWPKGLNSLSIDIRGNRTGAAIRRGMYAPQLSNWFLHYPRESMMILDYRDLKKNTAGVFFKILDFANVPYDRNSLFVKPLRVAESSAGIGGNKTDKGSASPSYFDLLKERDIKSSFPPMKNSTRRYLQAFFAPYNAQLEKLLGDEWKDAWKPGW